MAAYRRPGQRDPAGASRDQGPGEQNAGWTLFGYLISGMVVYGGLGWLIARWTHIALIFPLGMLLGLGLGVLLIILKYGRS
jgi:F0F1-type ATP synthase assembly protein I